MALIWAAHGVILQGCAERHPERKVPPRGSDSPAQLCRRYSATTSTIFRWRFLGCRGCGWHRYLRRYAPVPLAQTAASRSIGPSRGRQRSGLSEYKAWRSPPFGHIGGIRKAQAFLPALSMKLFSYFGAEPVRMTGTCLTFLPTVRRSSAKTISGVRSK